MFTAGAHQNRQPQLYEANARIFLRRLETGYGRKLTISSVPDEEWRRLAELGFDLVWLMGVWERSPAARECAFQYPWLRDEYSRALPGWIAEDVAGSPYAIHSYELDPALGSPDELVRTRDGLNRLGMRLIVDFVPNHVAVDNPWVVSHPEWFVPAASEDAAAQHPDWYFSTRQGIRLAHGRDPNFPPWTDTAQVNFYSRGMREALIGELVRIAGVTDGVRCDMAMLALNGVFERVWGSHMRKTHRPAREFWSEAIDRVRRVNPGFLFGGEAYWGLDRELLDLGFDYAYDKTLYNLLLSANARDIREHLSGAAGYLQHHVHFIENHDEKRAVAALGRERSLAAAAVIATLPGMRFFQDGQLEGRTVKIPVQLVREPDEPTDEFVKAYYDRLLKITSEPVFREGEWAQVEIEPAWAGNSSHDNLRAWRWTLGNDIGLAAVNYSATPAQGWIRSLPLPRTGEAFKFSDELNGQTYMRERAELEDKGLYIALDGYRAHIFRLMP